MIDRTNPAFRHGHAPKSGASSEYMTWSQMIQRCENPNNKGYSNYGGRGISVCERWHDFKFFMSDMGPRPNGFTLERMNNSLGYSPENCRWASRVDNMRNRRNCIMLTLDGVTMTAKEWSMKSPVTYRAFHKRLKRGWSLTKALNTPRVAA